MALGVLQKGYDVVSAEGQHISVKTVTTSSHVSFNKSTIHCADSAMILRINTADGGASIEELFRGPIEKLLECCKEGEGKYTYQIKKPQSAPQPVEGLMVTGRACVANRTVIQYENGSIAVETDGALEPVVMPILRQIAAEFGISPLNGNGNKMNTQQLGAAIIKALSP